MVSLAADVETSPNACGGDLSCLLSLINVQYLLKLQSWKVGYVQRLSKRERDYRWP